MGRQRWREEAYQLFRGAELFWRLQERLADAAWNVSSTQFPWPPSSLQDGLDLLGGLNLKTLGAAPYAFKTVSDLLPQSTDPVLRTFIDAQLLISAQTTGRYANALYGSAALDLPRRGVNHIRGGIGSLAGTLADWIQAHGGRLFYRQQGTRINVRGGRAVSVLTRKGLEIEFDLLVANLTPWGLANLLEDGTPERLKSETIQRKPGWGAFTLYLGLDSSSLPVLQADHFQGVRDPSRPLGEGNSVFISISDRDDPTRAPQGMRAATLSTHTRVEDWWVNPHTYEQRRVDYTRRVLDVAEMCIPGFREAVRLCLPGTPRTFAFYTRRPMGMVGGFPQTSLFRARGPWTGLENAWLVGDSVFPGQSTAGVTLGAMRVAREILRKIP